MSDRQEYTVQVADGRSVTVNAPSSQAAAKAAANWARENPIVGEAEQRGQRFGDIASVALQSPFVGPPGSAELGAFSRSFELQDELVGLGARAYGAATGRPINPDVAAAQSRFNIGQYREARPVSSLAEEMVAGGLLPSRAGRELLEGAAFGAITGAGSGVGEGQRGFYGAIGGALGGALGGVAKSFNPLIARIGSAARRVGVGRGSAAARALFTPEEGEAFEALAEAFRADGIGPDRVAEFAQAAAGDDKAALMDFIRPGGAVEALLRLAGQQTSEANVQLTDRLLNLTDDAVQGVQAAIRGNIGVGRIRPTLEALETARKEASEPLYEAFRQQRPIIAARLNEEGFGNSPTFVRAFESAIESALDANDQEVAEQLNRALVRGVSRRGETDLAINPQAELSPELLNRVKMQLDRRIDQLLTGQNPDRARAREVIALRDRFVDTLDRIYPDTYAAARSAYAGESSNIAALRLGRDMFKADIEELEEAVKRMGDSEYEAFRIGASRALTDRVSGSAEDSAAAPGRLLTGQSQDRIRLLFRGEEGAEEEFIDQLRRQRDRIRAARRATPTQGGADEQIRTPLETASSAVFEGLNLQPGSVLRTIITETRRGLESETTNARNAAIARIASSIHRLDSNAQEVVFRQLNQEFGEDVARLMRGAVNRVARGLGIQFSQREDPLTTTRIRNMELRGL